LNKCFGAHRFFYNKSVGEINSRFENRKQEFIQSETCIFCKKYKTMDSKGNLSFTCESHKNKALPWKLNINLASLRKSVMKSDSELLPNEQWQSEVPYDTRQLAIKKAVSAYTSCIVNFKNGNIQKFQMRFCCRKNPTRIFSIDSSALKIRNGNVHLFVSRLGNGKNINKSRLRIKKKDKSRIPEKIDCDSEMLYDRGAYYLLIPVDSLDCKVQN